jgi:putative ABC transport system permease protein
MMRPYALLYFYRRRLRQHLVQELLAGVGIAVAVALVLSTLVAEGSISSSTNEVVRAIVGPADLQLRARSDEGFPQGMLSRVEALEGIQQAAPLLEAPASVTGPGGANATIELAGANVSLATLDGLAHTLPISALSAGGVGLSSSAAARLDIHHVGEVVRVRLRGRASTLTVTAILGRESAGALSRALTGVMPLRSLQSLAGVPGRITRVLVQSRPGTHAQVDGELRQLAAGRLDVVAADEDVTTLRQALKPSDQASAFFAGVAGVLGLLFAFTAMLLTAPERRRAIADLRLVGTKRSAVVQMVLFQALCLGLAASAAGVLAGYLLSIWALHQSTGFLAEAFTTGTGTIVGAKALLLAFAGGVAATVLACAIPLGDLRRGRRLDAVYTPDGAQGLGPRLRTQVLLAIVAVALVGVMLAVIAAAPALALPASVLLAVAAVLVVPLAMSAVSATAHAISERLQGVTVLPVALASLRATSMRALALTATGGVAIFGSVALGAARNDLLRGIEGFASSYTADAPVWIANPDDNQAVQTIGVPGAPATIAAVPDVASVHSFQGAFVNIGDRRSWVIARPPGFADRVLATQTLHGRGADAQRLLAHGGWVAVSAQLAEAEHARVGGWFALPTPSGVVRLRLAATTTNLAWSPGAVFITSRDYARLWKSTTPTTFAVNVTPEADAGRVASAIQRALGPASGLEASTAAQRRARIDTLTSEGLGRLGEISTLLTIAAVLAMAAALASSVWQRRQALAGLRLSGVKPRRLRQILLVESLLMLGTGCVTGALLGLFGESVIDGYLRQTSGFPVAPVALSGRPLGVTGVVLAGALALVAAPVWIASRASPSLALGAQR